MHACPLVLDVAKNVWKHFFEDFISAETEQYILLYLNYDSLQMVKY